MAYENERPALYLVEILRLIFGTPICMKQKMFRLSTSAMQGELIAMISYEELRHRETERRKALWTLAHTLPGDVRALDALDVLDVLDDIERRERFETPSVEQPLSVEEVLRFVPTEPHPIGCRIVLESSIPQPWRERFLRASLGSTRVTEGPYAHDWEKFLVEWQDEMRHVERQELLEANIFRAWWRALTFLSFTSF